MFCIQFSLLLQLIMIKFKKRRWHILKDEPLTEMDRIIMNYENHGRLVPTRELIRTPEEIEGIRCSGIINTGVLDAVAEQIHIGMSTQEIDDICYKYTIDHGAIPACLNYNGYPKSVCVSINEEVCHGIPDKDVFLKEGDIVNVDYTTIKDGFFADASRMFIMGKTTPEKEQLVRVAKECLEVGMEAAAKPYCFVGDIGSAVQKHAHKYGYSVVRDLCGHGIGLKFHEDPEVEHVGRRGEGMLIVPGMVFTIEPMINMGTWRVFVDADNGWTVVSDDYKPSAQWEHTFVMTEHGLEILTY